MEGMRSSECNHSAAQKPTIPSINQPRHGLRKIVYFLLKCENFHITKRQWLWYQDIIISAKLFHKKGENLSTIAFNLTRKTGKVLCTWH